MRKSPRMLERFDGTPCRGLDGRDWTPPEQTPQGLEFIRRILADPTDDATRAVFADWLEEQGSPGIKADLIASGLPALVAFGWVVWRPFERYLADPNEPPAPDDYRDFWLAPQDLIEGVVQSEEHRPPESSAGNAGSFPASLTGDDACG